MAATRGLGKAGASILRSVLERFNKALRPGLKQIGPAPPRAAITTGAKKTGPGAWRNVNEAMSPRARAYQAKVTGSSPNTAYVVNTVKFDGFENGFLVEAKGPGYAHFIKNGRFQKWWLDTGGEAMLTQAKNQLKAAGTTPVQWRVAEPEAVDAIRRLFHDNDVFGIEVVHVPA
ncbi:hypothetical protein HMPREF1531_01207 [Propionibacterium sp. oral taxon 192 str. F0372]|uniref:Tox-REase-5 domain-containing protein n=1 Tax=Propionibacterium sp. oral taxon 192 TaxID=671222 RepID=UPI000352764B|nr:Tox-REase-5 domain-containing protein [Propionibacterium sp. oral taxon 192]EPH03781.1 hypothetical protein HMPREF1531_01207 [Propionibacterium sp. oral taxon 192 str. F0372]